jgi:DNA-binding CsgD family transcriptional regulator
MLPKRNARLRKLRHVYQLLHHVQVNGFDESLWRRVLLQGLERCFHIRHIWSGLICEGKVACDQLTFNELALSANTHPLVQMCDQFEHRWLRTADHMAFDTAEVIQWVDLMLDGQSDVWHNSQHLRMEVIELAGREVLLLTYRLNTKQLRCFLFESANTTKLKHARQHRLADERRMMRLLLLEISRMIEHTRLSRDCFLLQPLSPREAQTSRFLLQGFTEKQIAKQMYLSPHTVHTYIKSVYRQFGVTSRAEFTALFVSHVPMDHYFRMDAVSTDVQNAPVEARAKS